MPGDSAIPVSGAKAGAKLGLSSSGKNVERPRVNPDGARSLPATKPHKLSLDRQEQLRRLAATGEPVSELAAAFGVGRATAYRYLAAAE